MKICMVGAGYVGLVSGSCFADLGNFVWCVDKDKQKIDMLNKGEIPIFEPGLKDLINKNYSSGRLKFTTNLGAAIKDSNIIFICVGTPNLKKKHSVNLQYVFDAVVTFDDTGKHKPSPEPFKKIVTLLNIPSENILFLSSLILTIIPVVLPSSLITKFLKTGLFKISLKPLSLSIPSLFNVLKFLSLSVNVSSVLCNNGISNRVITL